MDRTYEDLRVSAGSQSPQFIGAQKLRRVVVAFAIVASLALGVSSLAVSLVNTSTATRWAAATGTYEDLNQPSGPYYGQQPSYVLSIQPVASGGVANGSLGFKYQDGSFEVVAKLTGWLSDGHGVLETYGLGTRGSASEQRSVLPTLISVTYRQSEVDGTLVVTGVDLPGCRNYLTIASTVSASFDPFSFHRVSARG